MRTRRTLLLLALALACGGLAAYATMQFLNRERNRVVLPAAAPAAVQIVVAARDLPYATELSEADIKLVDWPGDAVPEGVLREVPNAVGRPLIAPVMMNEPILDAKLADRGAIGLIVKIPEGMRGVSMAVNDVSGVSGYILPGHRVDFMLTLGAGNDARTQTFLQNIEVAASGPVDQVDENGKIITTPTLTFLVTPEQAEKITHATSLGRISLMLRGPADVEEVRTRGIRVAQLWPGGAPAGPRTASTSTSAPPPPSSAPALCRIQVINGNETQTVTVPCGSGGTTGVGGGNN